MNESNSLEPNVIPVLPLIWFDGDGLYGEVKRDVDDGTYRTIVICPEELALLRYPEIEEEWATNGGTIQISVPRELVFDLSRDPVSPRMKSLTNLKGEIKASSETINLQKHIEHLKQQLNQQKLLLLKKNEEDIEMFEDFKGSIRKHENIRELFKGLPKEQEATTGEDTGQ